MEEKETFRMTYSAKQQEEIQKIRKKYIPQEENKLERLRALDEAVSRKANIVSLVVGIVGTLILGLGMSLAMSEFGKQLGVFAFPVGVAIGVLGLLLLALAYPLYQRTLKKEREKAAPEILRLSEELMK